MQDCAGETTAQESSLISKEEALRSAPANCWLQLQLLEMQLAACTLWQKP